MNELPLSLTPQEAEAVSRAIKLRLRVLAGQGSEAEALRSVLEKMDRSTKETSHVVDS